ncbi:MAG: anion permease [Clostridia bacterium]|nr:anion permease [Clostridia bacterium]
MIELLKKEKIMTIAIILAIISMFFVAPDSQYLDYINWRVLALLFCLMTLVKGFQEIGLFELLIEKVFGRVGSNRMLCLLLVIMCFFMAMLITNDVSLLAFVPFAIYALRLCHQEQMIIRVVVLQTLAANLGSMFSPIGNPHNLYLYAISDISPLDFMKTMFPITILAFVLLVGSMVFIPRNEITFTVTKTKVKPDKKLVIVYSVLFLIAMLVVFRVIPWYVAVITTVAGIFVVREERLFKKVDYSLLFTFVGFFIFVGNMARIPEVSGLIESLINGNELVMSVACSQFMSNVPASILLSGFSDKYMLLAIGTDIGGMGTLIASMASLISFKLYGKEENADKKKYILIFTLYNVIGIIALLSFALIYYR